VAAHMSGQSELGAGREHAPVRRKMWRVCVFCDELFTSNQRHYQTGAAAAIRLAKQFPRSCVAPGACDECLEVRDATPMEVDDDLAKDDGDATIRCSEGSNALGSRDHSGRAHGTDVGGVDENDSPRLMCTPPIEQPKAPAASTLSRRARNKLKRVPKFEPAINCSNRFAHLPFVRCSR